MGQTKKLTIHTQRFNKRDDGPNLFVRRLFNKLKELKLVELTDREADVVFLYTKNEEAYRQAHPGVPVAVRCGGVWHNEAWRPPMEQRYVAAKAAIFQSEFCRRDYYRYFGQRNILSPTIINGSDFKFCPLEGRPKEVVCNAAWRESKRPWLVSKVARAMPDVKFNVIGDFKTEHSNNVNVIGPINYLKVEEALKSGRVFFHTGLGDPCPNCLVEACVSGMVPVAPFSGGAPEIVNGHGFLYDEKPSIDDIVRKIKRALAVETTLPRFDLSLDKVALDYYRVFSRLSAAT